MSQMTCLIKVERVVLVVSSQTFRAPFDFSKTESQSLTVHGIRFAFLVLVFLLTLSFQVLESRIDALQVFYPLYILIGISGAFQFIYFSFFKSLYKNSWVTQFLFYFEAFYVTGLIYFIGVQQSILIFLYLVNLILSGVLFQRRGALILALWTSVLFSFIVSLDTSISGNTAYLAVGVNNLAFFTVAYLSGFLSEQLNIMGEQLEEKVRDVKTLKNLNDLILNNISSGLLTVDKDNIILQGNASSQTILGMGGLDMIGARLEDIIPGFDLRSYVRGKEFDFNYKKNGERRILNVNISHLRDENTEVQGNIISFQDETHLRALEKRVRQSEKMAAIGQLATGIAHEIRNPLAGISGSIQLMQMDDEDRQQSIKLMGIVMKEIDRLNNLITEFLDFAKPEAPLEDQVDIGHLIEDILTYSIQSDQISKIEKHLNFDSEAKVLGNRDKLKQAFLNIIVNAIQAMEKSEHPVLSVDVKKISARVSVCIKDSGIGMSEELRQRIFEPFHTTKNKGTGLGLAITHSIIEAHRAEIQVESEPGQGTEFRMTFKAL